uniref:Secreted protein n=1 Tax=Glossina palpalis gambiensis TaxID=67801 RepID=A0A1B0C4F6_9MUSC
MNVAAALKLNIFYLVILGYQWKASKSTYMGVVPSRCTGCVRTTRLEMQISVPVLEVIKSRTLWRVGTSAKDA